MNNILRFVIFLTILTGTFSGFQYYIVRRLSRIFQFTYTYKIWLFFLLTVLNFIAVTMLSRRIWNIGIQGWYLLSVVYIGSVLILFSLLLFHQLIHRLLPLSIKQTQYLLMTSFILLFLSSFFCAFRFTVRTIEIPTEKNIKPITIVQLTDLHLGMIHGQRFVKRVVSAINTVQPDIVVITGDFFDRIGKDTEETMQEFNNLSVPAFFILGNHDRYADGENVLNVLKRTPIQVLRNETVVYKNELHIIGLDYIGMRPGGEISSILQNIALDNRYFTLLLNHIPIDFPDFEDYPIDLVLAGHTHGGQIFPFHLAVKAFYPRAFGLYKSANRYIYVSPGTGTWGPPMRFGTRSEITVIRIVPKSR